MVIQQRGLKLAILFTQASNKSKRFFDTIVEVINAFKGFFLPIRDAILDRCFIKIAIVMDSRHKKAPSFYRLAAALQKNPKLASGVIAKQLTMRLAKQRSGHRRR